MSALSQATASAPRKVVLSLCCGLFPTLLSGLGVLSLAACTGDFGRPRPFLFTEETAQQIYAQVPLAAGEPVTFFAFTDDEKLMRNLAYPLLLPPYEGELWIKLPVEFSYSAVLDGPVWDPTVYVGRLMSLPVRSEVARYERLINDIHNDMSRIPRFYMTAKRVADMDRKRDQSLPQVAGLSPVENANAQYRIADNGRIIANVDRALGLRSTSYRFALERLVISQPSPRAVDAERALVAYDQRIGAVVGSPVAALPPPPGGVQRGVPRGIVAKD
ncbi:MAG TPA: hypothetical protein VHN11_20260 [Xanthobacteraceae bacterium]|nr:hypothetical protein [Xanthobacteraceae bacterium]